MIPLSYAYISISIISLAMMIFTAFAIVPMWNKKASKELALIIALMFIGSAALFFEAMVSGFEGKLFWRNASQIGLFLLPAASFNFIMEYTREKNPFFLRLRLINFMFAVGCVLLIFTNEYHHIMRSEVTVVTVDAIAKLRVTQTITGKICVSLNTLMNVTALVKLWIYVRKAAKHSRPQIRMVLLGFLIPVIYTYTNSALQSSFGIVIPISASFLLGILVILWGMYRYDFLSTSPIARDWVLDEISIGMIFSTPDGRVADMNKAVKNNFGETRDTIQSFMRKFPQWSNSLDNRINTSFVIELTRADQKKFFRIQTHALFANAKYKDSQNHDTRYQGSVSLIYDISEEMTATMQLQHRAEHDSMTQVLNRKAFEINIEQQLQKKTLCNQPCSLLVIDIDHFKQVNDSFGHQAGDQVLQEVVTIIHKLSRDTDIVGRLGGDEFGIFLTQCDRNTTKEIANRIHKNISQHLFTLEQQIWSVTVSIGISQTVISQELLFTSLYMDADKALYRAKERGRNCISE